MIHTNTSKNKARDVGPGAKRIGHIYIDGLPSYSCGVASAQGFNDLSFTGFDDSKKTVYDILFDWVNKHRKPVVFTMIEKYMSPEQLKKEQKKGKYEHVKHICSFETWHGDYMVGLYCLSIDDEA